MTKKRKWMGTWPAHCDICKKPLDLDDHFFDARTKQGPWGLLCERCFDLYGVSLGPGFGQMYNTETLEKEEG